MSLALLIGLQAAAAAAPAAEPSDFDLARYRRSEAQDCGTPGAAEILVCGRRLNQATGPSAEMERRYGPRPLGKAEIGLGGGLVGRAFTESVAMDRGAVSKRLMIGIKLPF